MSFTNASSTMHRRRVGDIGLLHPKVIHRPARVEPKVHLANERTLFHWLNMAVILTTVAVGFLNSSLPGAAWMAVLFTAAAVGLMVYALRFYYWRMERIARRDTSNYSDLRGPIAMAIMLLSALLIGLAFWVHEQP
ncbi:hypothetical protein THASP1DRAFT_28738 [Thamnocephalis sphaerospora]|uniref:DUF202 domain-containing protein n=1 Tax=Thamnocephalis sphaerospora TaxID=78915 RepID=A0A4V1IX13_9FUNG|nr:hypothetical protein THASP1DRAFT_28738 [Thamnocephalis sphaerospora]|eukprot:RKP09459.1 hypothetical protein THASP1DRAFT_28738 [Thamnocephalis sphaerospora]